MSDFENKQTYGIVASPQNKRLISELQNKGENVIVFPALKTERIDLTETESELLRNITDFDWIVFTDIYAADYFLEALGETGTDFFELDNLTVCAFGEAVADRLRYVQVHSDVIPSNFADDSVFSAISQFSGGNLENLKFLIVGEKSSRFEFAESLKNENASVVEMRIYQSFFEDETANGRLKTLLKGGAADEFVFSSAEDLLSIKSLLGENDLSAILNDLQISAATEIAYQTLRENSLRPLYFHHK